MVEVENVAEDSTVYYGMKVVSLRSLSLYMSRLDSICYQRPGITWQSGRDVDVRGQFASNGQLINHPDTEFRPIGR